MIKKEKGPNRYAFIFSALYQYHRIIPVTYRFRVFGVVMNDKLFLYILAIQLAFSQSFQTLTPALCGILTGALYRTDIGNIKQWRFPQLFQKLTDRFIKPFLLSPPIARSSSATPTQLPILASIPTVENLMSNGLRNRQTTNNTSTPGTPSVNTTEGAAPSVRVT